MTENAVVPETTASDLLHLDHLQATTLLSRMPLEHQRELVLSLPPGKLRQDLIILSEQAKELTASLPVEEFAVTVLTIGPTDALSLIDLSSDPQLSYLLDLQIWAREDLDLERLGVWMALLLECGPERFVRWTQAADLELLVLLLERFCLLVDRESVAELPEALAGRVVSPDNFHFFVVKLGVDFERFREAIEQLYALDRDRLFAITGNLGTVPPAELEELALRWRLGRLSDRGWPDLDEAQTFYQPLSPTALPTVAPPPAFENPPRFPLSKLSSGVLLPKAIAAIDDPLERDRLTTQIVNLVNRVIVADGLDVSALETLEQGAAVVAGRLELGLSELGAREPRSAAALLIRLPLLHIAQVGQHAVLRRRRRVLGLASDLVPLFAPPLGGRLEALAADRPAFLAEEGTLPRPFQGPGDLEILDQNLDRAGAVLCLARAFGIARPAADAAPSLEALLLTLFAHEVTGFEAVQAPYPPERLEALFERLPLESMGELLRSWAVAKIGTEPGLDLVLGDLTSRLEELLAHDPHDLDPRYVDGLWIGQRGALDV